MTWQEKVKPITDKLKLAAIFDAHITLKPETCKDLADAMTAMARKLDGEDVQSTKPGSGLQRIRKALDTIFG